MLHCQIPISHGRLFGLRIIFAMDPERSNLADFLTEIKCHANGALLPPGPGGSASSAPRPRSGSGAVRRSPPRLGPPNSTPSRGRAGCVGRPRVPGGSRRCLGVTASHPRVARSRELLGGPVLPPLLSGLLSFTLILVSPGQVSPGSGRGHFAMQYFAILSWQFFLWNSWQFVAILGNFGLDSLWFYSLEIFFQTVMEIQLRRK